MEALVALAAVQTGTSLFGSLSQNQANKKSLALQSKALQQQADELKRQREQEAEQQRRENEQLMNSVSGLTDTAFSGVSAPTMTQDKYGDMG